MKKFLFLITLISSLTNYSIGQDNVSFTVKPVPGQHNKAKLYFRSNAAISGVITQVVFTFTLPATVAPQPTATLTGTGAFNYITYTGEAPNSQSADGTNLHVYTFFSVPTNTTVQNILADTEVEIAEITFSSPGFPSPPDPPLNSNLQLVYLPNGGSNELSGFNIEINGNNRLNIPAMFYGSGSVNAGSPAGYSRVGTQITLPVDFLSFYAIKSGNNAKLNWSVVGDETNSHFEVLRSLDGRDYKAIQRVKTLANGNTNNSYEASDINLDKLNSREVYYQIAQFDKDGSRTVSPVRKLSVDGLGKSVTAFPNPARTSTKVVVDATEAGKGSLIMRDAAGRQVQVVNAQFNRGINQFEMNVMGLSSGEYNIQVKGGGLNETIKITKIN